MTGFHVWTSFLWFDNNLILSDMTRFLYDFKNICSVSTQKKIPRQIAEGIFLAMMFLYRGDVSRMVIESVRVRNDILRTIFGSIKSAV